MKKRQLTGPEPATSRPLADPLAAEPRLPPASIKDKRGMDQWMLAAKDHLIWAQVGAGCSNTGIQ